MKTEWIDKEKTLHISGKNIDFDDILEALESYDNRVISTYLAFSYGDEEDEDLTHNVFFRFYYSDKEISLDEVQEEFCKKIFGDVTVLGYATGYSEYTITDTVLTNFKVGNHDIAKILDNYKDKYLHILISIDNNE